MTTTNEIKRYETTGDEVQPGMVIQVTDRIGDFDPENMTLTMIVLGVSAPYDANGIAVYEVEGMCVYADDFTPYEIDGDPIVPGPVVNGSIDGVWIVAGAEPVTVVGTVAIGDLDEMVAFAVEAAVAAK